MIIRKEIVDATEEQKRIDELKELGYSRSKLEVFILKDNKYKIVYLEPHKQFNIELENALSEVKKYNFFRAIEKEDDWWLSIYNVLMDNGYKDEAEMARHYACMAHWEEISKREKIFMEYLF